MARSFTYDAENRQVTATIGSGTSTYVYDGLGQRVSKTVSGQMTTYVYDVFGNLAAEYGGNSTSALDFFNALLLRSAGPLPEPRSG